MEEQIELNSVVLLINTANLVVTPRLFSDFCIECIVGDNGSILNLNQANRCTRFMWELWHPQYLRVLYVRTPLDALILHQRFDERLDTYIADLAATGTHAYTTLDAPPERFVYVPDIFRKLFKSMMSFLCYIHTKRFSFSGNFGMDNLVLLEGELKFYNVRFIADSTADMMNADYRALGSLIMTILGVNYAWLQKNLPDMKEFIRCLRDPREPKLIDHIAVNSLGDALKFIEEVEDRKFEIAPDAWIDALTITSFNDNWRRELEAEPVNILQQFFANEPVPPSRDRITLKANFFRLLRNASVHLRDVDVDSVNNVPYVMHDDVYRAAMFLSRYGKYICFLQLAMHKTTVRTAKRSEYLNRSYLSLLKYHSEF